MGRAALFQSEVLVHNITSLILGRDILETYKPIKWIEGSLKLTLGRVSLVLDRTVEQSANPCCAVSDRNILARRRWKGIAHSAQHGKGRLGCEKGVGFVRCRCKDSGTMK
jgi:hypothetical protein